MTTILNFIIALVITLMAAFTLQSCSNNSLQQYMVDKQDDDNYVKVDLATSLLLSPENTMSAEEKEILSTVKKINVVAYPVKDGDVAAYEAEKQILKDILDQEKYQTLMKMGSNRSGATLKYVGEEDAIDEVIIFVSDEEKGFAVFRLTGDDMKPGDMMKLMNSLQEGDLDIEQLSGIGEIFTSATTTTE